LADDQFEFCHGVYIAFRLLSVAQTWSFLKCLHLRLSVLIIC
jgi:hypothetical protein